jgi:putative transposase
MMEQVTIKKQPNEAKENGSHKSTSQKSKRGRPKGSRNKNRKKVELSPYLQFVPATLKSLLSIVGTELSLVYFVFDGAFGNNDALQMVRQCDLHLISKLRFDAALYLPYAGEYCGRGRRRKYGNKLNYKQLPEQFLKSSNIEGDIQTRIYQMKVWHKLFADLLNVVIIVKTNLKTGKTGHVILFSSDLELACEKLIEYYQLRFQIEFNFRDAKQYWGLEDFRNVSKNAIYNAANLAMFMVNLSSALLRQNPSGLFGSSVNDLKAWFRARKYVLNTLKLSEQNAHPIFIERTIHHVSSLGRVNPSVCQI